MKSNIIAKKPVLSIDKPILVTGSHRSGTTWTGRILSQSPSVGYIHEPFNINHRLGVCASQFEYWFTYINSENEYLYYDDLRDTLSFTYNLVQDLMTIRSLEDIFKLKNNYENFRLYNESQKRPLMKDPIAIFSAEWLSASFNMDVIVLIRHPAAFVSSLKRKNWTFPFNHLLEQPMLMRDYLSPFEDEIFEFAQNEHDLIDQAILLWRIIHYVILKYQNNDNDWIFIRHEDISRDPIFNFQLIFKKLNLEFNDRIKRVIKEYCDGQNHGEQTEGQDPLKRNSKANIWNWKNRLTSEEIGRIRTKTEDISTEFYAEEDW